MDLHKIPSSYWSKILLSDVDDFFSTTTTFHIEMASLISKQYDSPIAQQQPVVDELSERMVKQREDYVKEGMPPEHAFSLAASMFFGDEIWKESDKMKGNRNRHLNNIDKAVILLIYGYVDSLFQTLCNSAFLLVKPDVAVSDFKIKRASGFKKYLVYLHEKCGVKTDGILSTPLWITDLTQLIEIRGAIAHNSKFSAGDIDQKFLDSISKYKEHFTLNYDYTWQVDAFLVKEFSEKFKILIVEIIGKCSRDLSGS